MTCKEIIESYEEGGMSLRETLFLATEAAVAEGIEASLQTLPLAWRKEVELHIFDTYDNEIDSDDFIYIGRDEPDLDLRRRKVTALRGWIAKKKVTDSFTRNSPEP